jgi:ammonia channel protein AmtB
MVRLKIDDPLDSVSVHFVNGIWGVASIGLFATQSGVLQTYGIDTDWGVFYGGAGYQLGVQVRQICAGLWSVCLRQGRAGCQLGVQV